MSYLILVAMALPIIYIALFIYWVIYFENKAVLARKKRARLRRYNIARRKREAMWRKRVEAVWKRK